MDHPLRCNALKCRRELNEQAVVTTCSHVFCIDCANQLQLANGPPGRIPICPACDCHLKNPDDAVITNLNPTEDYKTSILSGLSPHIIMECATRALSFWAYQSTQEVVYYDYLAKTLSEKYTTLNSQLDKVVHDANSELQDLRSKVANLNADQIALRRKNEELIQAYNEKSRKQMRTQELYDKMKRRDLLEHVQEAASEAVDDSINASMVTNRFPDRNDENMQQRQAPAMFPPMRTTGHEPVRVMHVGITPAGNRMRSNNIFSSQESQHDTGPTATPSHRQRLTNLGPQMTVGIGMNSLNNTQAPRPNLSTPNFRRVSPGSARSPLGGLSGYGMSAGVKFSQPRVQSSSGDHRQPSIPPRVAQRPASGQWGLGLSGSLNALGQNLPNTERYF